MGNWGCLSNQGNKRWFAGEKGGHNCIHSLNTIFFFLALLVAVFKWLLEKTNYSEVWSLSWWSLVISYCFLLEVFLKCVTSDQSIQVFSLENNLIVVALNVSFPYKVVSKTEFICKDVYSPCLSTDHQMRCFFFNFLFYFNTELLSCFYFTGLNINTLVWKPSVEISLLLARMT